ncbi:MAG: S8 family peptidase [Paludibaculum sp.]
MRIGSAVLTSVLYLLLSTGLFGQNSKLAPDLAALLNNPVTPGQQLNVIVQLNPPGLLQSVTGLVGLLPGVNRLLYSLIPAVTQTLPVASILSLANLPTVKYISLDRPVGATLAAATDYSHAAIGANFAASYGLTGDGIGVAILDSGISNHADLAGRVVYRESFVSSKSADDYGHGSHVAGIVAGNGSASRSGVTGIAPGAKLIDLRVLDANGMSSDSVIIAALDRAVQLKSKYNIRVINLSVGRPVYESCKNDPLVQAVEAAWKQGIVVVVAAGNFGRNGYSTILSPGNSPLAITVGAMKTLDTQSTADDQIASYSSKGPTWGDLIVKPDIVAPGNLIMSLRTPGSTLDRTYPDSVVDGSYARLSGTSMAAPMVSGAAALMLQRTPGLSPDTVKARLMKTASKSFPLASVTVDPTTRAVYPGAVRILSCFPINLSRRN